MDMPHCIAKHINKENITTQYCESGGVACEQRKVPPLGKMANVLREQENSLPYDSGDEWEIGLGDLIIDLDADLEKEKHTNDGKNNTPEASPLKIGKMKIKRKTSGVKSDSAKYEIAQKKDESLTPTKMDIPPGSHEHLNGICTDKLGKQTPEDKGGKSGRSGGHHKRDGGNRQDKNSSRGNDSGQNNGSNSSGDGYHGNADGNSGSGRDGGDNNRGSGRDGGDNNRDREKDNGDKDDHNDDDNDNKNENTKTPKQKHERKKSKAEKVTVAVGTSDMGTVTEPECLAPCEPGTSVNLEGIVWHETDGGVLVVNVTWRNKTYVGTLLDCSKHDWAPPRFCDSPTSDMETRTPKAGGRGKRGRSASNTPLMGSDMSNYTETRTSIHSKLRNSNGKGRRGSAAGARTPTNGLERGGKRKNKPMELDLNSSHDEGRSASKRMRANSRGTPTTPQVPLDVSANEMPPSPVLIECPEPNCGKKYKHINGLRYHQTHAHLENLTPKTDTSTEEPESETPSASSEESNSSSVPMEGVKEHTPAQSEYDFSDSNSKNTTVKGHISKGGQANDGKPQTGNVVVKQEVDAEKSESVIKETEKPVDKVPSTKTGKSKHDKVSGKPHKHGEKGKVKDGASGQKPRMKKHVSSGEDNTLEFQAMVDSVLSSTTTEIGARKDVVTVAGTVTPALPVAAVTSVIQKIKTEPGLKESSSSSCCNMQPPPSLDKVQVVPKEEIRTCESVETEGPKKKEKDKHKSGDKEKHKKSKSDKSVPKVKSATRPIAPAPPVPQLIAIPGFASTSTTGGTVTITPVTTNPQATPISPPLIPIQPKPTVMGEPIVNPSLTSLKERKHKSKKKSKEKEEKGEKVKDSSKEKDNKEKQSKQENEKSTVEENNILKRALTESGIFLDETEKSPSPPQSSDTATVFPSSNVANEPPKAVVAPTRPEIPKLIPVSDSVPKTPAAAHVITATPKVVEAESLHRHDRQGTALSNLSANTAAVAPNSHAPTEPLQIITTAPQGSATNQDARSPAYSDISDANDDVGTDGNKQCDDPYQFNDDSQPPAVKTHHTMHGEMRKERDEVSVYAPYSTNLTTKVHSPPVLENKKRPSEESMKYKDSEKQQRKDNVESAESDNKKLRKDDAQPGASGSQFPEQHNPSPKMLAQQMYPQYPYMPGYMGYSIDRTYHMHLMATDPHYRHQHEKFMEEQERMRQEHERMEREKREKPQQEKLPRTPDKESDRTKSESAGPSKNVERKEHRDRSSEPESWPREERNNERMKEKQRENHQIMAESIELKSQVAQAGSREQIYDPRVLYDHQRQREDIRQHYLYQQKVLEQQRYEEERRRHQQHHQHHHHQQQQQQQHHHHQQNQQQQQQQQQQRQQGDKDRRESSDSKQNECSKETLKKDRPTKEMSSKPDKEVKSSSKVNEDKTEERELRKPPSRHDDKSHPTLEPKPSHHQETAKYPEGYPAYIQHPYMQSPHYGPVPFDPAYRPVNPIMAVPAGGYPAAPFLPPEFRYSGPSPMVAPAWKMAQNEEKALEQERERERERERSLVVSPVPKSPHVGTSRHASPERAPKALELLQQHASQYYNAQHKNEARQSPDRKKTVSPARPRSRSRSPTSSKQLGGECLSGKDEEGCIESGMRHDVSPPMQRHLHTHHHTHHVGMGYPIIAAPYDPYATVLSNQTPVAGISPYTARRE